MSRKFLVILLLFGFHAMCAQIEDRYMVFYKDKAGSTFSVDQPQQFLSQKAITRRSNQNIAVTTQDFPPNAGYVSSIRGTGAYVLYTSRWFNASLVEATAAEVAAIQQLANVERVEFVAPGKTGTGGRTRSQSKFSMDSPAPATDQQASMLGLDAMRADGLDGTGITIAVLDTGFPGVTSRPAFADMLQDDRIKDFYNFAFGYPHVFLGYDHGTQVLSILGAELETFKGAAPKADYLLYTTEYSATEYRVEEYYWAFAAERADSAGVDIINTSLGYTDFDDATMNYTYADMDGETTVITQAAQMAFARGIVVVVAAGNLGGSSNPWHFIAAPADGKDVLAVGAVESTKHRSAFSSFGPSADGRVKPDVAALGTRTASISSNGLIELSSGTSYACPLITGFVACLWQAHPELTAIEVIDLVRKAGSQYFNPDFELGYGIPTYQAIKNMFEFPNGTGILLYPNPIQNDMAKIAFAPTDGQPISYQVSTILGQRMHSETYLSNWHANPFEINFSNLPAGVYLVNVQHGATSKTFRVVKP
jgi:serine protease AprX